MALKIEKRHTEGCVTARQKKNPHAGEYDDYARCRCSYRAIGMLGKKFIRKTLKTADYEEAKKIVDGWERKREALADGPRVVAIQEAITAYLDDAAARNLAEDTRRKLSTIFEKQLVTWAEDRGYTTIRQIASIEAIRDFRSTWKDAPLARSKKQDRVVGFFYFCHRSGYIASQPITTKALGKIKVDPKPTDYFTPEEFNKLVDATYRYRGSRWEDSAKTDQFGARLRAAILLMRWSGLRARDAFTLEWARLCKTERGQDAILLYQEKTGEPVYCVIPPDVTAEIRSVPPGNEPDPRYFFWSGNGLPKSAVADFQRSFRRLVKLAKLEKRAHPHMLRDTFAVECLLAGVPLEKVSILLGHKSIKITEKHYKPFVKALRYDLEDEVTKSWPTRSIRVKTR